MPCEAKKSNSRVYLDSSQALVAMTLIDSVTKEQNFIPSLRRVIHKTFFCFFAFFLINFIWYVVAKVWLNFDNQLWCFTLRAAKKRVFIRKTRRDYLFCFAVENSIAKTKYIIITVSRSSHTWASAHNPGFSTFRCLDTGQCHLRPSGHLNTNQRPKSLDIFGTVFIL